MSQVIVKVQISQNDEGQHVLIYPEDRRFIYQGPATPEIVNLLGGRPKAFFYMPHDARRSVRDIQVEAPWQEW